MGEKNGNNRGKGNPNGFGGKYVRKAENLTAKQLKAAGAKKAAAKRTVSISDTKRAYGTGKTLGPGGKPLTGSVRLENGNMAVYKDGKRVTVAPKSKPKPAASAPSRSTTARTTTPRRTTTVTTKPAAKPAAKPGAKPPAGKPGTVKMGNVYTTTTQTDPQSKAKAAAKSRSESAARSSGQVPSATRSYANGAASSRPRNNGSPAAKVRDWVAGLSVQGPVNAVKSAAAGANKKKK